VSRGSELLPRVALVSAWTQLGIEHSAEKKFFIPIVLHRCLETMNVLRKVDGPGFLHNSLHLAPHIFDRVGHGGQEMSSTSTCSRSHS
jgi:hypothetical protein